MKELISSGFPYDITREEVNDSFLFNIFKRYAIYCNNCPYVRLPDNEYSQATCSPVVKNGLFGHPFISCTINTDSSQLAEPITKDIIVQL